MDEKLIEAACRAWQRYWQDVGFNIHDAMRAAIAAIDASGTHVVVRRCQPRWGSCGLPSGHYGQHDASPSPSAGERGDD